jgi:hypothetical protein
MRMARFIPSLAIAVLLLYLLSYVALLQPKEYVACVVPSTIHVREPAYCMNNKLLAAMYSPLLWLDKRVRPKYWQWIETPTFWLDKLPSRIDGERPLVQPGTSLFEDMP